MLCRDGRNPFGAVVIRPAVGERVQFTVNKYYCNSLFDKYLKELLKMFNDFIDGQKLRDVDKNIGLSEKSPFICPNNAAILWTHTAYKRLFKDLIDNASLNE